MIIAEQILVIDLEATCWEEDGSYQKQHSEIIEIGVCLLNTITGDILKNKGILVKPVRSEISAFCTKLTSITTEMIEESGVSLKRAFQILKDEYNSAHNTFASYGMYDKTMMLQQSEKFNLDYPMSHSHINVKNLFSETMKMNKRVGMNRALQMLDIPLEGTHHRGVDDAKNIAKILKWTLINQNLNH